MFSPLILITALISAEEPSWVWRDGRLVRAHVLKETQLPTTGGNAQNWKWTDGKLVWAGPSEAPAQEKRENLDPFQLHAPQAKMHVAPPPRFNFVRRSDAPHLNDGFSQKAMVAKRKARDQKRGQRQGPETDPLWMNPQELQALGQKLQTRSEQLQEQHETILENERPEAKEVRDYLLASATLRRDIAAYRQRVAELKTENAP